jgi:hypothetical protein
LSLVFKGRAFDGEALCPSGVLLIDSSTGVITGFGERGAVEEPKDAKRALANGSVDRI